MKYKLIAISWDLQNQVGNIICYLCITWSALLQRINLTQIFLCSVRNQRLKNEVK